MKTRKWKLSDMTTSFIFTVNGDKLESVDTLKILNKKVDDMFTASRSKNSSYRIYLDELNVEGGVLQSAENWNPAKARYSMDKLNMEGASLVRLHTELTKRINWENILTGK